MQTTAVNAESIAETTSTELSTGTQLWLLSRTADSAGSAVKTERMDDVWLCTLDQVGPNEQSKSCKWNIAESERWKRIR